MIPIVLAFLINIVAIPIVIYVGIVFYRFLKKKQKPSKLKFIFAMLFLCLIVYPVNMMVLDFLHWEKKNDAQSQKKTTMQELKDSNK